MTVIYCDVQEDYGCLDCHDSVPCVTVACPKCDNVTESCGTDEPSIRRCLALLRETCPRGESNFYRPGGTR